MKIWSTKYALTTGVQGLDGQVDGTGFYYKVGPFNNYVHKPYWHETLEEAHAHAEVLRASKIKALHTQIKKLEAKVWSV